MLINRYLLQELERMILLQIAEPTAKIIPYLFSLEMWGGATFDVAYRFLKEDPWESLTTLRKKFQMFCFKCYFRGSECSWL